MKYQKHMAVLAMMVLIAIACGGEKQAESPASPYYASFEAAQAAAAENSLPILVDFYTDW